LVRVEARVGPVGGDEVATGSCSDFKLGPFKIEVDRWEGDFAIDNLVIAVEENLQALGVNIRLTV